jgi:hypothetical protein|tara:strand:- start:59 stop:274 length:216 start_codon:yes stop_codon:yes gene_type:complete
MIAMKYNENYDKIVKVIESCETKDQLDSAKNMVETQLLKTQDMTEYMTLVNRLFNQEMKINYATKDSQSTS